MASTREPDGKSDLTKQADIIRKLVPASVKRRLAPYLRPRAVAPPEPPKPRELAGEMTCVGEGVRFDPSVWIEFQQGLAVGNDVTVGKNVHIDAQGGVILCDGAQISENVTITSSLPLPASACDPNMPDERMWDEVFIGKNVWLGPGACVLPGISIGDDASVVAGTLVEENVPAGTVYGLRHKGGELRAPVDVSRGGASALPSTDPTAARPVTGRERRPDICFVASTGRSGSTTIADLLNKHPRVVAKHEPRHQLIKLSADYAHGILSREEVKVRLERLFLDGSVFHPDRVHVESDLKYFNLLPVLNEIFPDARFIWLVRSGYEVVTSTHARSWFADGSHPVWPVINWFFHKNRVRGDMTGDIAVPEWESMTPFQRNCWYWVYVNETIARDMEEIPESRRLFLRLEDIDNKVAELLTFLGVEATDLDVETSNQAFYVKQGPETWTQEQHEDFERLCGPLMKRLYE